MANKVDAKRRPILLAKNSATYSVGCGFMTLTRQLIGEKGDLRLARIEGMI
jgi:hypothetical protein